MSDSPLNNNCTKKAQVDSKEDPESTVNKKKIVPGIKSSKKTIQKLAKGKLSLAVGQKLKETKKVKNSKTSSDKITE